jgi:ABC-2 type transport system permease protein
MNAIWTLTRKELKQYFNSPIAYVIIVVYLAISGWFFAMNLFTDGVVSMRSYMSTLPLILLFFVPAFSMRLIAEERKQGTLELLLTMPISDIEVVIGKFLGAVLFYISMLTITLIYPVVLQTLGNLDWGPVVGGYIGILLMGSSVISLGLFASSLSSNQIVAFILSFAGGFTLFLIGKVGNMAPAFLVGFISFIGFDSHFNNISKGIIDSRDLIYYFSLIFLMLFLTLQSLLNRKK